MPMKININFYNVNTRFYHHLDMFGNFNVKEWSSLQKRKVAKVNIFERLENWKTNRYLFENIRDKFWSAMIVQLQATHSIWFTIITVKNSWDFDASTSGSSVAVRGLLFIRVSATSQRIGCYNLCHLAGRMLPLK